MTVTISEITYTLGCYLAASPGEREGIALLLSRLGTKADVTSRAAAPVHPVLNNAQSLNKSGAAEAGLAGRPLPSARTGWRCQDARSDGSAGAWAQMM